MRIEKEHPEHWDIAKEHGFWDLRKQCPIKHRDLVVFWQSGPAGGPVSLVEAIGEAVSPAPGPFPWNDAAEQYQSRFHVESLSEIPRRSITWADLQSANR